MSSFITQFFSTTGKRIKRPNNAKTFATAFSVPITRQRWLSSETHRSSFLLQQRQRPSRIRRHGNHVHWLSLLSDASVVIPNEKEKIDQDENLETIYRELQWLSQEIRRHDDLYYNNNDRQNDNPNNIAATITDDDYDALVRREHELCTHYPELLLKWQQESGLGIEATRSGGRVGISTDVGQEEEQNGIDNDSSGKLAQTTTSTSTSRFRKRTHLTPMLSLDNVTTKEQLYAWLERIRKKLVSSLSSSQIVTILTEPKLDGLSLSLRYQLMRPDDDSDADVDDPQEPYYRYKLLWASTRGDGTKGQDVTLPVVEGLKLPTLLNLPQQDMNRSSQPPNILEIRGEVVLPKSIFQELKETYRQQQELKRQQELESKESDDGDDGNDNPENATISSPPPLLQSFSNARNAASGILLRKQEVAANSTSSREPDDKTTTLQLQSLLKFYAYDIAVENTGGANDNRADTVEWIEDAMGSRQQMYQWGFFVPNPIAITTLELDIDNGDDNTNDNDGDNENEKADDSNATIAEAEEDEVMWTDEDIQPMLQYYTTLGQHREQQQQQQQSTNAKKGNTKSAAPSTKEAGELLEDGAFFGDYDMDGCVHKICQAQLRRAIGNSNRAPRWAVAHKYPSQSAITSLLDIEVQVGRKSGALTPVAILKPVEVSGGVKISKATLHNFEHMKQLFWYGHVVGKENNQTDKDDQEQESSKRMLLAKGTKVLVRRAGDVIPQVVQLAEPPKQITVTDEVTNPSFWMDLSPPKVCPACGSPTVSDIPTAKKRKKEVLPEEEEDGSTQHQPSGGPVLRCSGPPLLCQPRAVGALAHAYSRDALDISGLSEAKIQQLFRTNQTESLLLDESDTAPAPVVGNHSSLIQLRYPSDIFKIAKDPAAVEAIAELPGWGPKSSQNLANNANKVASDGVSLSRFIYSLSIRFAGVHSSKIIATAYGTVGNFLEALEEASQIGLQNETDTAEEDPMTSGGEGSPQAFAVLSDKDNEVNKGIGPAMLSSLITFSRQKELVQAAKDLASVGRVLDDEDYVSNRDGGNSDTSRDERKDGNRPFSGQTVVFTGKLSQMDLTRKQAQELAKKMGAKSTPGTISKSTDIVVAGDSSGDKKLDKARQLGIRIISEEEFREIASSSD